MGQWRAAALLGLIAGTFSTIAVSLGAGRIGRDIGVDWMIVATVLLGDEVLRPEPSWAGIAVGILMHQVADLWWAFAFFGILGRWTATLSPTSLLCLAVPWAALTSALEYFLILPRLQPLLVIEQPFWVGFVVHSISASVYPLFPWLQTRLQRASSLRWRRSALVWCGLALACQGALATAAYLGSQDREVPYVGTANESKPDRHLLRLMTAHHEVGISLARLAVDKAESPRLRALAKLMVANQAGELRIMSRWWRSWFKQPMPAISQSEISAMPGMPSVTELAQLATSQGADFDRLFAKMMSAHHQAVIDMANHMMKHGADPRLIVISDSIAHAQSGEIKRMNELAAGVPTLQRATEN